MNRRILWLTFSIILFYSCHNDDAKTPAKPENDIDAAREFIRSALDGRFEQARDFLLQDSFNTNYLDLSERLYQRAEPKEKAGYREASIKIHRVTQVNDSTTIVIFSNSFKNNPDTLKVLKMRGQWLVDLKYLYDHDLDTSQHQHRKDSLP
jgi:hypothetical protein